MDKIDQEKALSNSEEVSLKDIILKLQEWWRYFLSKWVIILLAGIIGGAYGFIHAYRSKPGYKAQLSFVVQDEKSGGGLSGALGLASQFGIDLGGGGGGGEFSGENLLELMKSRSMVQKALLTPIIIDGKTQTLVEFYISFNKIRSDWKDDPKLKDIHFPVNADPSKFTLQQDSLLGVFHKSIVKDNLLVDKLDKKLSIINLQVISGNELFSKSFVEVLASVVSDFYVQTKTKKAAKNVAILQRQTDSVRRVLNAAISGVAVFTDATPNPNPALQTLHVPSDRRKVDVQTSQAILTELVKNLEIARMSLLQETPLIQVIDRPILPLEKVKLSKLINMVTDGVICGFLCVFILSFKKLFKDLGL